MSEQDATIRSQLRIPAELYERVKGAAEASGRSMNAEIVRRLEDSFSKRLPADWTIRTQVASAREIALSTVEMMRKAVTLAEKDLAAGKQKVELRTGEEVDLAEHVSDLRRALEYFEKQRDGATELLSQIAMREASSEPMSANEMDEYVRKLGLILPGTIQAD